MYFKYIFQIDLLLGYFKYYATLHMSKTTMARIWSCLFSNANTRMRYIQDTIRYYSKA